MKRFSFADAEERIETIMSNRFFEMAVEAADTYLDLLDMAHEQAEVVENTLAKLNAALERMKAENDKMDSLRRKLYEAKDNIDRGAKNGQQTFEAIEEARRRRENDPGPV